MGRLLAILDKLERNGKLPTPPPLTQPMGPLAVALHELERQCPDHVDVGRWQAAVVDGKNFLTQWEKMAEELGWTADNVFGIAPTPPWARRSFRRTARYDLIGLAWMLDGRKVVALTPRSAAIAGRGQTRTIYNRR